MYDLEKAIRTLEDEDCTCVVCRDDNISISNARGIAPILDYINKGMNLIGGAVADKIVGKAAALLFVHARVSAVYGRVMSREATEVLKAHSIGYSYGILTDKIINRQGTGICPMEDAVKDINDPCEAYTAICKRQEQLRKGEYK
jgi:hypothetical protein